MSIQMTIVGLGQIGVSVGLALAQHTDSVLRVGHDREPGAARQAEKMGALDRGALNLISAVREADIVLLSLPMDQVRETLAAIAQDLKEGAVVMDTSPVKEVTAAWAGELLPNGRYYVGLTPAINPAYLHLAGSGLEAARPDLFQDGMLAITAPPRTPSRAIQLATDLTHLLGALPLYADTLEIDSLMSATHLLPHLLGVALLNATADRPGWREARKIAGRPYAGVTGPVADMDGPEALRSSLLLNRENALRMLDGVIAELQALRQDVANQDDEVLLARLERARRNRDIWWSQRQKAKWAAEETGSPVEPSTTSEMLGRLVGLGRRKGKRDGEKGRRGAGE